MANVKKVEPIDIPEVVEFINADERLKEFRQEYDDVFQQYDAIVTDRNDKLEAAEKIVRAHEVSCGPFDLYSHQTKYDAQAFYDAVGREEFLKLGGNIQTVPKYDIDKKTFEAMVAQKKVAPSVVEVVVTVSPRYKVPSKIST